jgi:membrane-associated phospholipid phosphatase
MSALEGTSTTGVDPRDVYTDPRVDTVWRHEGAWWAPLSRRPYAGAVALGVLMVVLTIVLAVVADLPIRDADGVLGQRMWILLGSLGAFFALEIIPRTFRKARGGVPVATALRAVLVDRWSWRRLRVVMIGLVSFYATYISYRNIKSFLPFLVDQNHDRALLDLERSIFGGTDPAELLHGLLGTGLAAHVLSGIYLFYLAFIPISLGASLILASNPIPGLWWVTALGINWTLGALSYYLLPSLGPAFVDPQVFSGLPQTGVTALQESLWTARNEVLTDPFSTSQVQSIAAFASLHTSVVFSAAIIAHCVRTPRLLRWSLWIFLGLVVLSTMYFGWHYIIDDVAGLAIGAIAVALGAAVTGHWRVLFGGETSRA